MLGGSGAEVKEEALIPASPIPRVSASKSQTQGHGDAGTEGWLH